MRRPRSIVLAVVLAIAFGGPRAEAAEPSTRPVIWVPYWRAESESVQIAGNDPIAGRALELFVWREGAFEKLAGRRSDARGDFDFGFWPVSSDALVVVVTPADERPTLDRRARIERPLAAPVVAASATHGARAVSIYPAYPEGELRIFHPRSGALLDRIFLDADARKRDSIDFIARLGGGAPGFVVVRQVLPNGRTSQPAYLSLRD